MSDRAEVSLGECVAVAASNSEFVDNWTRLRGFTLPASPIERMVDEASGHGEAIAVQFIADVRDLIYSRLVRDGGE